MGATKQPTAATYPCLCLLSREHTKVISAAIGGGAGAYRGVGNHTWGSQPATEVHPDIPAVSRPLSRLLPNCR